MGKNPAQKAKANAATAKDKDVVRVEAKTKKKKVAKVIVAADERCCKISKCKRPYRAKGYCQSHYKMWKRGEYGLARYKTCKANDCRKPMTLNRHGLCEDHFQSIYVKGVAAPKPAATPAPAKEEKQAQAS